MDEVPESDRLFDLPHPREQSELVGHAQAEQQLLKAYMGGKAHHAWILGGSRGIGKATLAYRFARFALKYPEPSELNSPPTTLHVDPDDPVFRRVASSGHSDVFVARRIYDLKSKRLRSEISAETIRKTSQFYTRTAGEGGWRLCIVDAADDMNKTAANALLKVLEEPPPRALFILVAHAPGRLLATIRSRCINLQLNGLSAEDLATVLRQNGSDEDLSGLQELAALSRGSPGRALELLRGKGWSNFQDFAKLIASAPNTDHKALTAFAERIGARGAEAEFRLFFELLSDWLAASIRRRATTPDSSTVLSAAQWADRAMPQNRLGEWSKAWQQITHSIERTNALNLDRKQTVLQAIHTIEEAAAQSSR